MADLAKKVPPLCMTALEKSWGDLEKRLKTYSHEPDLFHEIRLDALPPCTDSNLGMLKAYAHKLLCTLRSQQEGGLFAGDKEVYQSTLQNIISIKPFAIDVEIHNEPAFVACLRELSSQTLIICSQHVFTSNSTNFPSQIPLGGDIFKYARATQDASELEALLAFSQAASFPHIAIGMNHSGILSRILFSRFGNLFTFVSPTGVAKTAPGQLDYATARAWRLPQSAHFNFIALIGGAQIAHSPGPNFYNQLFSKQKKEIIYIPVETQNPEKTLNLLKSLGCLGASVTMPHKSFLLQYATPDNIAQRCQSANSLLFKSMECTCTDLQGIYGPLKRLNLPPDSTALILGNGATARAAYFACQDLGFHVSIAARNQTNTTYNFPHNVTQVAWAHRAQKPYDIIINTTPLTEHALWPESTAHKSQVYCDLAITGKKSIFETIAQEQSAAFISAKQIWLEQGKAQMKWLLNIDFDEKLYS